LPASSLRTRDAFAGTPSVEGGRPLSISIIGWWWLMVGAGMIATEPFERGNAAPVA
jgi:hypothetical protein